MEMVELTFVNMIRHGMTGATLWYNPKGAQPIIVVPDEALRVELQLGTAISIDWLDDEASRDPERFKAYPDAFRGRELCHVRDWTSHYRSPLAFRPRSVGLISRGLRSPLDAIAITVLGLQG